MKIKTKHYLVSGLTSKNNNNMKRYRCEMNDGEYCASFHQLKDAKKYRSDNNWRYISRYIRIFDNKKDIYII